MPQRYTRVNGAVFSLQYKYISGYPARVAVVVSKKFARTAVLRHQLKRMVHDALFHYVTQHHNGIQMIITCQKRVDTETVPSANEIKGEIMELISKINPQES